MILPLKWMPAAAHGGAFKVPAATFVTIHCTESDNSPGSAEAIAGPSWFGGPKAGTSSHKVVDVDSICEGVRRGTVAYHAGPGGNSWGVAYEFCGRVAWSAAKWREPAQLQMLRNAAPHIADDLIAITGSRGAAVAACRWLSVVQVAQHAHGLCTHNDIRLALGGTTHTDPGPNFPYAELLAYVRAELAGTPAAPAADPKGFLMALTDAQQAYLYNGMVRLVTEFMGPDGPDADVLSDEKGVPILDGQTLQNWLAQLPDRTAQKVINAPLHSEQDPRGDYSLQQRLPAMDVTLNATKASADRVDPAVFARVEQKLDELLAVLKPAVAPAS